MAASMKSTEMVQSQKPLLEPLELPVSPQRTESSPPRRQTNQELLICLFCETKFDVSESRDDFLRHLVLTHRLVIADFRDILDFHSYIDHWRERFKEKPVSEFCCVIQTNSKDSDPEPSELFYLLCDALEEDRDLRHQLQKDRLRNVLIQQQQERLDESFSHGCLFCREHFNGKRAPLFNHLTTHHNFNVGHPDNLVYTDDLLTYIETKLESLQCLYCEKTFKDKFVLKEHMRKKQHKKINPKNHTYDKYYVINYLEFGKNWEEIQSEDDKDLLNDEFSKNDDWDDWREEDENISLAVCLFCQNSAPVPDVMEHMNVQHGFNLAALKKQLGLTFYQQVKLVNYVRRQVYQSQCISCSDTFSDREDLLQHLGVTRHFSRVPETSVWDRPEYFFPTYENDNLLCALEDDEDDDVIGTVTSSDSAVVIAEDIPPPDSDIQRVIMEEFELETR